MVRRDAEGWQTCLVKLHYSGDFSFLFHDLQEEGCTEAKACAHLSQLTDEELRTLQIVPDFDALCANTAIPRQWIKTALHMNKEWGQTNFKQFGIQHKAAILFVGRLNGTVHRARTTTMLEKFPKGEADKGETSWDASAREVEEEVTLELGQACREALRDHPRHFFTKTKTHTGDGVKSVTNFYTVDVTDLDGVWDNEVDDCFVTNLAPGKETDYAVWRRLDQLEQYVAPRSIHTVIMRELVKVCPTLDYGASTTGSDTGSDTASTGEGSDSGAGANSTTVAQSRPAQRGSAQQVHTKKGGNGHRSTPGAGYVCKVCKEQGHWWQQCSELKPCPFYKQGKCKFGDKCRLSHVN